MQLSIQMLCDYLPKGFSLKPFGPLRTDCFLTGPVLHEPGCSMESPRLYVGTAETFSRIPPDKKAVIACTGPQPPQPWVNAGCTVLFFPNENLFHLFNTLALTFEQFHAWEQQLCEIAGTSAASSLAPLLKKFAELTHLTIRVADSSLISICSCDVVSDQEGHTEYVINTKPDTVGVYFGQRIKDICHLERKVATPYISRFSGTSYTYYCCNLYSFGQFAGCISVNIPEDQVRKSTLQICDVFFHYFQKAYSNYLEHRTPTESAHSTMLSHILESLPVPEDTSGLFQLKPNEKWMCFQLTEKDPLRSYPPTYMFQMLNLLMVHRACATLYNGSIVGVLRVNMKSPEIRQKLTNDFCSLLKKMEYTAGISNPFSRIEELPAYLSQAGYAASQTDGHTSGQTLFYFEEYSLPYMLDQCTGGFSAPMLFPPGFQELIDYDRKNRTDYLHTLRVYLDQETNISRTAEILFLHRSSIHKRLNHIYEILGDDLESPEKRLQLRIFLRLHDIL